MRFLLFVFFISTPLSAQITLKGKVVSEVQEPLAGVSIINRRGNEWSVTDEKGNFSIGLKSGDFELEFKYLSKRSEFIQPQDIDTQGGLLVILKNDDLRLDDVVVTAVPRSSKIGSSISLGEYAVNQVQSFSLADILQQLPGQEITPPSLNEANTISLRTAQASQNNAFGVSYLLDGVRLSNDANMQSYNSNFRSLTDFDNMNSGIDLRSIPAANIEEIEIISGIPDAEYGDLTSGLIRINRKAGVTPLTIHSSIRQGNTSVSVGKGLRLGEELGNLSLSLDYLNANADPRNSLKQYDRITASAIWSSYNRSGSLRNTFSATLHNNLDDLKYDKDNDDGGKDARFKKDRGIQLSNRLNWKSNTSLADNINLTLGYSYAYQHSYQQSFINDGGRVVPQNMETGLSSGAYTPVAYLMIREVYGQPINMTANASIDKQLNSEKTKHQLSAGINTSYSDNKGKGKSYDPENAHTQVTLSGGGGSLGSGEGIRPLDYGKYLDPKVNLGIYLQDHITYTFDSGRDLYANLGMRYDVQNSFGSFSPRVNLGYELSEKVSLRGGFGFASKAPSLAQIYPGDKFFDVLIRDFRTSSYSFNLVQTYKREFDQLDLEPVKSWKYEIGANYNPGFGNFAVTAYYNHSFDGIGPRNQLERVGLPEITFDFESPNAPPNYSISGYKPILLDYDLATNSREVVDKGIEFYLNLNKLERINTSISLNGSYTYTSSHSGLDQLKRNSDVLEKNILYGVHKTFPVKSDFFRIRATLTHHLSELGLLISLTAEQFTRGMDYAISSSQYPFAYIDANGQQIPIPEAERQDPIYNGVVVSPRATRDILTPTYHNFHLRATKELMNGLSLSLYANNFLNYRPELVINGEQKEQNSLISFGGQIKYQF